MSFSPQLAEVMDTKDLPKYGADDNWWFEQKLDGMRICVALSGGTAQSWGRDGKYVVKREGREVEKMFKNFPGEWVFDGEYINNEFWMFDMPVGLNVVNPSMPYCERRQKLDHFATEVLLPLNDRIRLTPTFRTTEEKLAIMRAVIEDNGEGIVVKHKDSPYIEGKRSPKMLKAKFWESVDCIVTEVAREGKRSVAISVWDGDDLVDIGSCTVTDRMLRTLQGGEVIEVKYLYAADPNKPRIYQPSFLRIRHDKAPEECTIDQIKYTSKRVLLP